MDPGRGRDRGRLPPTAHGGHSPDSGVEARLLCAFSQLRQRRPGEGEGWSALYRWPLSQKQPVRKRSSSDTEWRAGKSGSLRLGDPRSCWVSLPHVENPAGAQTSCFFLF